MKFTIIVENAEIDVSQDPAVPDSDRYGGFASVTGKLFAKPQQSHGGVIPLIVSKEYSRWAITLEPEAKVESSTQVLLSSGITALSVSPLTTVASTRLILYRRDDGSEEVKANIAIDLPWSSRVPNISAELDLSSGLRTFLNAQAGLPQSP